MTTAAATIPPNPPIQQQLLQPAPLGASLRAKSWAFIGEGAATPLPQHPPTIARSVTEMLGPEVSPDLESLKLFSITGGARVIPAGNDRARAEEAPTGAETVRIEVEAVQIGDRTALENKVQGDVKDVDAGLAEVADTKDARTEPDAHALTTEADTRDQESNVTNGPADAIETATADFQQDESSRPQDFITLISIDEDATGALPLVKEAAFGSTMNDIFSVVEENAGIMDSFTAEPALPPSAPQETTGDDIHANLEGESGDIETGKAAVSPDEAVLPEISQEAPPMDQPPHESEPEASTATELVIESNGTTMLLPEQNEEASNLPIDATKAMEEGITDLPATEILETRSVEPEAVFAAPTDMDVPTYGSTTVNDASPNDVSAESDPPMPASGSNEAQELENHALSQVPMEGVAKVEIPHGKEEEADVVPGNSDIVDMQLPIQEDAVSKETGSAPVDSSPEHEENLATFAAHSSETSARPGSSVLEHEARPTSPVREVHQHEREEDSQPPAPAPAVVPSLPQDPIPPPPPAALPDPHPRDLPSITDVYGSMRLVSPRPWSTGAAGPDDVLTANPVPSLRPQPAGPVSVAAVKRAQALRGSTSTLADALADPSSSSPHATVAAKPRPPRPRSREDLDVLNVNVFERLAAPVASLPDRPAIKPALPIAAAPSLAPKPKGTSHVNRLKELGWPFLPPLDPSFPTEKHVCAVKDGPKFPSAVATPPDAGKPSPAASGWPKPPPPRLMAASAVPQMRRLDAALSQRHVPPAKPTPAAPTDLKLPPLLATVDLNAPFPASAPGAAVLRPQLGTVVYASNSTQRASRRRRRVGYLMGFAAPTVTTSDRGAWGHRDPGFRVAARDGRVGAEMGPLVALGWLKGLGATDGARFGSGPRSGCHGGWEGNDGWRY
ncbi:hypothetical protein HDU96_009288 [Phlyctochytrium bullatum]|nr:hypothetical protein HDU96_009288 [Phlyctochytrium bullatum]